MKRNQITLACVAIAAMIGVLGAYGTMQVECPCCHNSDGNVKGNCVLRQRIGTCSEDYCAQHNNKSNCPWCGSRGHTRRVEAWMD